MNGAWSIRRLGDLVETQKGFAFKSGWYSREGRPIVKVSDLTSDSVDVSALTRIPESIAAAYLKYELKSGDVVIQTVGSWPNNPASVVGKCVRMPNSAAGALLNQNAVKLSPTHNIDQDFLFYLLRNENFKSYIIGTAQGAASQAAITLEAIRDYAFALPPFQVQKRIANMLLAYDELIENSERRIRVLETMARAVYREWFVRLKYPGHQHDEVIDGVPEGWETKTLKSIAETNIDSYSTRTLPQEINYIDISSVQGGRLLQRTRVKAEKAPGRARRKIRDGDVIWSNVRPNLRQYALVIDPHQEDVVSTGFTTLTPESVPSSFLYVAVTADSFIVHLVNHATGASYPAVRPDDFERAEVLVPSSDVLAEFHSICDPIFRLANKLDVQNKKLSEARDLLLPRLISGQLDVMSTPVPATLAA